MIWSSWHTEPSMQQLLTITTVTKYDTHSLLIDRADCRAGMVPRQLLPHGQYGLAFRSAVRRQPSGCMDERVNGESDCTNATVLRNLHVYISTILLSMRWRVSESPASEGVSHMSRTAERPHRSITSFKCDEEAFSARTPTLRLPSVARIAQSGIAAISDG